MKKCCVFWAQRPTLETGQDISKVEAQRKWEIYVVRKTSLL